MALLRVNDPEFRGLSNNFSDVLDRFFEDALKTNGGSFVPTVDLSETDKAYNVEVNAPGMKKDDINLEVDGNTLHISGEKKREDEDKGKTYHRIESEYGYFHRALDIPEDADLDSVKANYEDGILNIEIPKSEQKQNKKKIEIK